MNATKADADKGAKEHPNAPKTKDDLTAEIAKLKKALDECEKDPCGAKGKDESHTPGFPGLNAKPEDLAKWIMDLTYPECTDDKDKTKKEAKQRLEDAKAAAARLPANSQLAEDVKPYLKKLQDFLDKNIDELPPCTVNHLDGYNGLPRPVKLDDDIKKILEWIKTLPPQLPECSDDKEKTKQFVEQMLRDAKDAEDLIKQASQVDKFSKKALEALKESQEAIKKIQDYLDNKLKALKPCKEGSFKKSNKFIFHPLGYYSKPDDDQTYAVTFFDSGETCTFGKSEAIEAPLTPTDVSFNPISRDAVQVDDSDKPATRVDGPGRLRQSAENIAKIAADWLIQI